MFEGKMETKKQIHGATNSPVMSETKVMLGNREYKLVHLPYRDYVQFICLVEPALKGVLNGGFVIDEALEATSIIRPLLDTLPELAWLCLKQTNPKLTVEDVMEYGKTPVALANIVLAQIKHNNMIEEFASFFTQATTLLSLNKKG
jgi:hypothetical protein